MGKLFAVDPTFQFKRAEGPSANSCKINFLLFFGISVPRRLAKSWLVTRLGYGEIHPYQKRIMIYVLEKVRDAHSFLGRILAATESNTQYFWFTHSCCPDYSPKRKDNYRWHLRKQLSFTGRKIPQGGEDQSLLLGAIQLFHYIGRRWNSQYRCYVLHTYHIKCYYLEWVRIQLGFSSFDVINYLHFLSVTI